MKELGTGPFISYGAIMKGYILMPEIFWKDLDKLSVYLNESYEYVLSLEPK
jgi:hypothetical protein